MQFILISLLLFSIFDQILPFDHTFQSIFHTLHESRSFRLVCILWYFLSNKKIAIFESYGQKSEKIFFYKIPQYAHQSKALIKLLLMLLF
jgi:hypothetical protein